MVTPWQPGAPGCSHHELAEVVAAGNDASSNISPEVGCADPRHVAGPPVRRLFSTPSGAPGEFDGLTGQEMRQLEFLRSFNEEMPAFAQLQATKAQNLAHELADSPAGQIAWIGQLFGPALDSDVALTDATIY